MHSHHDLFHTCPLSCVLCWWDLPHPKKNWKHTTGPRISFTGHGTKPKERGPCLVNGPRVLTTRVSNVGSGAGFLVFWVVNQGEKKNMEYPWWNMWNNAINHPWLGMEQIPPIKMVMTGREFTIVLPTLMAMVLYSWFYLLMVYNYHLYPYQIIYTIDPSVIKRV